MEVNPNGTCTPSPECDGCRRGLPRNELGEHFYRSQLVENGIVTLPCTAPEEEKATGTFTVGIGGFSAADTQHMLDATVNALRMALPPTTAIALFLVDEDRMAFKKDGPQQQLYEGLAEWAKATMGRQG